MQAPHPYVQVGGRSQWFGRQVSDGAPPGPELDHKFSGWRKMLTLTLALLGGRCGVRSARLAWGACRQEARWLRTACVISSLCTWLKLSALWHFLTSGIFLPGHSPKLMRKAWTSDGGDALRLYSLTGMHVGVGLYVFLFEFQWTTWICRLVYFTKFGKVSAITSLFFPPLSLFTLSGTPVTCAGFLDVL